MAEGMALVEPGEEIALEGPSSNPLRRWSQALHSRVWDNETQQASAATGEVQICYPENLFTLEDSTLWSSVPRELVQSPAPASPRL